MIKRIPHPVSGALYALGRRRPVARCPRLSLRNYLMASLPPAPATADYTGPAASALANIYKNDSLGDCVIAGMAHVEGVLSGGAGDLVTYTDDQIIALYSAIGGYVNGDESTDQGCDEQTALNYWQQTGAPAGSHQIAGWLSVNGQDEDEVRQALYLFENVYFGVELPDAWVNPMPGAAGFTWDAAGDPDPNNGHCFVGAGYSDAGVTIDTWGMLGTVTWAAVAKYANGSAGGELYTVISQDAIAKASAKAPNGFDFSQLVADFDSIGGKVVQPIA